MGEHRETWIMCDSFMEIVNMMPTQEEKMQMLWAVVKMGFDDVIDDDLPLYMKTALIQMRATIRSTKSRHDAAIENGKKGGAPKGNQNAKGHGAPTGNSNASKNKQPKQPNVNENVNANVNGNVNENDNNKALFYNGSLTEPIKALTTEEQIRMWEKQNGL